MPAEFPLAESFSRFIHFFRIDAAALPRAIALLDQQRVRRRRGDTPVWVPLDDAERDGQTRFFLDSVRDYLLDVQGDPQAVTCASRKLGPQHSNLRDLSTTLDGRRFEFCVGECELYLFGTGIGALVLELCLEQAGDTRPPTVHDLATFNYFLRYVEPRQAPRLLVPYRPQGQPSPSLDPVLTGLRGEHGLTLGEWMALLLQPLRDAGLAVNAMDERAYKVQSYARIQGAARLDDLAEPFFLLRRVVKASYHAAPEELKLEGNPAVVRSFDNVVIGVSLEGLATMVLDTGHPFFAEIGERTRRAYFAHYLLALHQRMALADLAVAAARLPRHRESIPPAELAQVRQVRNRAVYFNLHHRLTLVSSSTPHEAVYRRLNETLGISELSRKVREDVAEFDEFLRSHLQEREAEQARLLNILVAAFAVVTIPLGTFGMNLAPYGKASDNSAFILSGYFWAPVLTAIALMVIVLIFFGRGRSQG
ncbi:MAG TPA: hypothetical protein VFR37_05160 [Longimicrobium sp.]|nr:hypothetical protein [Longimicrobium sp.]